MICVGENMESNIASAGLVQNRTDNILFKNIKVKCSNITIHINIVTTGSENDFLLTTTDDSDMVTWVFYRKLY